MKKIILLTQNQCPKCLVLENYLKHELHDVYEDHIEIVKREAEPKRFMFLARNHGIMATPALISGDDVLLMPDSSNTKEFLEKHTQ